MNVIFSSWPGEGERDRERDSELDSEGDLQGKGGARVYSLWGWNCEMPLTDRTCADPAGPCLGCTPREPQWVPLDLPCTLLPGVQEITPATHHHSPLVGVIGGAVPPCVAAKRKHIREPVVQHQAGGLPSEGG